MLRSKVWQGIALAALVSLVVFGCQKGEVESESSSRAFDLTRLEVPSTYYYQMQDTSQVYGQMAQSLSHVKKNGKDLVRASFTIYGGAVGESTILFDAKSGVPVQIESKQEFQGVEVMNASYYEAGQVRRIINAPTEGLLDTLYTPIPSGTYDWMQSSFLIQSMDLENMIGDTVEVQFYQGFGNAFVQPGTIVVAGKEQVSVPAGDFDTYHVQVSYAGAMADLYIETTGNRRLIQHDVPARSGMLSTVLIPESDMNLDG